MADPNYTRRADNAGLPDDDPFAELTRIMGHDPREPQAHAAPAADEAADAQDAFDDDFHIDLEKELMGELDFSEFEEPAPATVATEEQGESDQPTIARQDAYAPVYDPEPEADIFDTDLDAAFDAINEDHVFATEVPVQSEPSHEGPAAESQSDFNDARAHELFGTGPVAEFDEPSEMAATAPPVSHDHFGQDETVSEAAPTWQPAEPAAPESAFTDRYRDAPQESEQAADAVELSLEDELHALLSDKKAPVTSPPADNWVPTTNNTFGRANFTAHSSQGAEAPVIPVEPEPEPEMVEPVLSADDFADIFADISTPAAASIVPQAPAYAAATPEYAQAAPPPASIAAASAPHVEGLDALAAWQPEREWGAQPVLQAAQPTMPAASEEAPEIETVELHDAAVALVDDLDIPDVNYEAPAPAAGLYDDLEGEIAEAFGDLSLDEPGSATPTSSLDPASGVAGAAAGVAYGAAQAAAAGQPPKADAYNFGETSWQVPVEQLAQHDFDYEADLDQAIAMAAYDGDDSAALPRRGRGLLIAGLVAGVAVLGGAGLFAMSLFGGGSDAPALVLADTEPMKVRPENPGGVTVPNQDNQVYQRVAGGQPEATPAQPNLITSAEEPVDITAQSEPEMLPPGVSTELDDVSQETAATQPKSEDRLAPDPGAEATGLSQDTAVVAPRRVRTMVVRPDGTMVPREETAPAAAPQAEETVLAAVPLTDTPTLQAPGAPATNVLDAQPIPQVDEADPAMPDTVAVVPSRRSEPNAPAPVAPSVAQRPATPPPAATRVSAPAAAAPAAAAAASEWSMQIASQPTAEGAQSTYQDLARRYGGVLEGRGVNIVRADIEGMGTYFRVRIPASNRDEAIQLCTRYKAAGGSCFVSR